MANPKGYQHNLSKGDLVLKNEKGRGQKFNKIISVLHDFRSGMQLFNKCLDIGCSAGIITSLLGQSFLMTVGIDIDQEALSYAKEHYSSSRIQFLAGDAMSLPFKSDSFDVIVCNHIYEHVPDAGRMMDEIYRVLKKEGVCYFSAGNKFMVIEGHYRLPFLSWLPKHLANIYLRLTGKGKSYYEDHLSLGGLKHLVQKFQIHDYTLPVIRNPERFFATDLLHPRRFLYKWIRFLSPILYPWIPTYIWILTKKR